LCNEVAVQEVVEPLAWNGGKVKLHASAAKNPGKGCWEVAVERDSADTSKADSENQDTVCPKFGNDQTGAGTTPRTEGEMVEWCRVFEKAKYEAQANPI
jgi:hypothetical protein